MRQWTIWRQRRPLRLTSLQNWCHTHSLRQTVSMQASNIRIGANLHSAHACYVYCTLCLISYALFCLQINTFTLLANSCPGGGGGGGGRIVSRWSISARNDANSFHLSPFALFILSLLCWHRSAHSNAQAHTHRHYESDTQKSPTRCWRSRNERTFNLHSSVREWEKDGFYIKLGKYITRAPHGTHWLPVCCCCSCSCSTRSWALHCDEYSMEAPSGRAKYGGMSQREHVPTVGQRCLSLRLWAVIAPPLTPSVERLSTAVS